MINFFVDEAEAVLNTVHHDADKDRSTLIDKNVNLHRLKFSPFTFKTFDITTQLTETNLL